MEPKFETVALADADAKPLISELKHTTPRDYRARHGRLEHSAIETTTL